MTSLIDAIIAFESGSLDSDSTVRFFGALVESGDAWSLQGFYGRTARDLIDAGYIDEEGTVLRLPSDGAFG